MRDWFIRVTKGKAYDFPYPVSVTDDRAYLLFKASEIEDARGCCKLQPLPLTVVPFVIEDTDRYRRPKGGHVVINSQEIRPVNINWGVDIEDVTLTYEVMRNLPTCIPGFKV
ncbi:MAG: hypothetical protein M0R06_02085, partial [Sphaerochaeta sp.]|jgi:hypothetical protein|nr:hypothetical protein [Sphaerochaeta sp.]